MALAASPPSDGGVLGGERDGLLGLIGRRHARVLSSQVLGVNVLRVAREKPPHHAGEPLSVLEVLDRRVAKTLLQLLVFAANVVLPVAHCSCPLADG